MRKHQGAESTRDTIHKMQETSYWFDRLIRIFNNKKNLVSWLLANRNISKFFIKRFNLVCIHQNQEFLSWVVWKSNCRNNCEDNFFGVYLYILYFINQSFLTEDNLDNWRDYRIRIIITLFVPSKKAIIFRWNSQTDGFHWEIQIP